jgi:hypothetical protein
LEEIEGENNKNLVHFKGSSLDCFTNDGIHVYLEMTFFYKLVPGKIKEMYLQFGQDWLESLARISIESIKETSIEFESKEYFTKRNEINNKIKENLQKSFDEKAEQSATVGKSLIYQIVSN